MNEKTFCPGCTEEIRGCHCNIDVHIIGRKKKKENKPQYNESANNYKFEYWCGCGCVLGLGKKN